MIPFSHGSSQVFNYLLIGSFHWILTGSVLLGTGPKSEPAKISVSHYVGTCQLYLLFDITKWSPSHTNSPNIHLLHKNKLDNIYIFSEHMWRLVLDRNSYFSNIWHGFDLLKKFRHGFGVLLCLYFLSIQDRN